MNKNAVAGGVRLNYSVVNILVTAEVKQLS